MPHLSLKEGPATIHDSDAVPHGTERVTSPHELAALLHTQTGEHLKTGRDREEQTNSNKEMFNRE